MTGEQETAGAPGLGTGLAGAVLIAVPTAAASVIAAVALVLALEAPGSGLAGEAWRVLVVDQGTWFTVAVASIFIAYAVRPIPATELARWLARRDLPRSVATEAGRELRRTRCLRILPAVLGACVGSAAGNAYNLALEYEPRGTPVTEALLDAAGSPSIYNSFGLVVGGYLVGVVVAEVARRRPRRGPRRGARLATRRPQGYLTRTARLLPVGVAALIGVCAGVVRLVDGAADSTPTPGTLLLVVLLLVVGVPAVQWLVVRRPQAHDEPTALALDDTFRSSAAHAIVGVSTAGGLAVVSELLTGLWNASVDHGGVWPWLLVPLGFALFVLTFAVWVHYGSSHPGARPAAGRR